MLRPPDLFVYRKKQALTDFVLEQSNQRKSQAKIMEKTLKTKIAQQSLVKKTKEVACDH